MKKCFTTTTPLLKLTNEVMLKIRWITFEFAREMFTRNESSRLRQLDDVFTWMLAKLYVIISYNISTTVS